MWLIMRGALGDGFGKNDAFIMYLRPTPLSAM